MLRFVLGVAAICAGLPLACGAFAEEPSAADVAAVKACTDLVAKNAEAQPLHHGFDEFEEKPGPEGRLAAAAQATVFAPTSCIGVLATDCVQKQGKMAGDSVYTSCRLREAQVWDRRLNEAYRAALAKMEQEAADNLRKTERAWIAWRDASCEQPWSFFQGSMASPMQAWCVMSLTGNQAIWVERWAENAGR